MDLFGDGVYTKDQLLDYLKQACPEGLAIFLAHDFEIQEFASGRFALKIGYTATTKSGKIKDELWLTEVNAKTTGKFKGLRYFTNEKGDLDKYVEFPRGFKSTGMFSKLSKSGRVGGFSFTTKALFQLIMLNTGHISVYTTIGYGSMALCHLTAALGTIARNATTEGDVDATDDSDGAAASTEEEDAVSASEEGHEPAFKRKDNKRRVSINTLVVEGAPAKRTRVG
ncbi:hypothetical protein J4E81_007865 [Alternaria sp. BMP 2799]|nr:hypothetical protein J4E81_007865 [Alternaria sp. BMP 2799]